MPPKFNQAQETIEERKARLEAYGKALDESLRKPPQPQYHLTPSGQLRRGADQIARQAVEQRRIDINQEVARINEQLAQEKKQSVKLNQFQKVTHRQSL